MKELNYIIAGLFFAGFLASYYNLFKDPPNEFYKVSAKVVSVHDGDTMTVAITKKINVRLLNCWAPELDEPNGILAKNTLLDLTPIGSDVIMEIPISENLSNSFTFGRVLANIFKNNENVGEILVEKGLAKVKK